MPELHTGQVVGLGGCTGTLYLHGIALAASTELSITVAGREVAQTTTAENGFLDVALDGAFPPDCSAGETYEVALLAADGAVVLTSRITIHSPGPARLEIDPPTGGCNESTIVVRVYGMPPGHLVHVVAGEAMPFVDDFITFPYPPLETDESGFAESVPFRPPWLCRAGALSMFTHVLDDDDSSPAATLYYVVQ